MVWILSKKKNRKKKKFNVGELKKRQECVNARGKQ
jgi:hypothetical protein